MAPRTRLEPVTTVVRVFTPDSPTFDTEFHDDPSEDRESGVWRNEFADPDAYEVIPTAWFFSRSNGERVPVFSTTRRRGAVQSVRLVVDVGPQTITVTGLRRHEVFLQLDVLARN